MDLKRCARCKETKSILDFGKDRRNKDGLNIYCKVCKKQYNDEQREYRLAYYETYHKEHRKEEQFYSKTYRKDHPENIRKIQANYRSKLKANGGIITEKEIDSCLNFFNEECAYSGVPLSSDYHLDHVVPVSKDGKNVIHNLVPCLPTINLRKAANDFETWYPKQSFYSEQRYLKIKEWMKKGEEQ